MSYHQCLYFFRFGLVEDQKGALRLYTVQIPHKREKKPPLCYLTKWDGNSFLPMLTAPCGTEVISSLAIRLMLECDNRGCVLRFLKMVVLPSHN